MRRGDRRGHYCSDTCDFLCWIGWLCYKIITNRIELMLDSHVANYHILVS